MKKLLRNRTLIAILAINAILIVITFITASFIEKQLSNPAFWITWVATFPINIGVWFFIFFYTSKDRKEDEVNLIPLLYTASVANIIFVVIGLITMHIKAENYSWKAALIIELVALIIYFVVLMFVCTGITYIRTSRETTAKKVFYIRDLYSDLEAIYAYITDAEVLKKVQALADDVKFSDPMSHESLIDVETEIKIIVSELVEAAMNNENETVLAKVDAASKKIKFRNTKCKILK